MAKLLEDAPDGVLTRYARTAYQTMAWVVGLVGAGVALGAMLTHGVEARGAGPHDLARVEQKIDDVDRRVRDLQVELAQLRGELHPMRR